MGTTDTTDSCPSKTQRSASRRTQTKISPSTEVRRDRPRGDRRIRLHFDLPRHDTLTPVDDIRISQKERSAVRTSDDGPRGTRTRGSPPNRPPNGRTLRDRPPSLPPSFKKSIGSRKTRIISRHQPGERYNRDHSPAESDCTDLKKRYRPSESHSTRAWKTPSPTFTHFNRPWTDCLYSTDDLYTIRQGDSEPLREFAARFSHEYSRCPEINDRAPFGAFKSGLRASQFCYLVHSSNWTTYGELMKQAKLNDMLESNPYPRAQERENITIPCFARWWKSPENAYNAAMHTPEIASHKLHLLSKPQDEPSIGNRNITSLRSLADTWHPCIGEPNHPHLPTCAYTSNVSPSPRVDGRWAWSSFHSPLVPNSRHAQVESSLTPRAERQACTGRVFTHLSCRTASACGRVFTHLSCRTACTHGSSFHSPLVPNGRHARVDSSLSPRAEQQVHVVEFSLTPWARNYPINPAERQDPAKLEKGHPPQTGAHDKGPPISLTEDQAQSCCSCVTKPAQSKCSTCKKSQLQEPLPKTFPIGKKTSLTKENHEQKQSGALEKSHTLTTT
ncbi:hypothetical protein GBA52_015876 [Prunus armeniaca]|nr:hypothetical protein GBA52_015876 [Prunus armeniaca]